MAVKKADATRASSKKTATTKKAAPEKAAAVKAAPERATAEKSKAPAAAGAKVKAKPAVKKAPAVKLSESQVRVLGLVHQAGESGYAPGKGEAKTIEALLGKKLLKRGKKVDGVARFLVTKAGAQHVTTPATPTTAPAAPASEVTSSPAAPSAF